MQIRATYCAVALAGLTLLPVPLALADVNPNAHPAPAYSTPPAPGRRLVARTSALIPNAYLDANTELAWRAVGSNTGVEPTYRERYYVTHIDGPGDQGDPHRFMAVIDHHANFYELHVSLKKVGKATRLDAVTYLRPDIPTEGDFGMQGPLDIQDVVRELVQRMVREAQKGPYPSGTEYEYALESALRVLEAHFPWATLVQSPEAGARVHATVNKLRRPLSLQSLRAAAAARKSARGYMQIRSFTTDGHKAKIAAHVGTTPLFPTDPGYDCDRGPQLGFRYDRGFWFLESTLDPIC
ncbi:MAG: hypothetical protein HXX19_04290 [Rhodoferax sp.]|nr:hypothetical protein [Rhodoferax sp.]